MASIVGLVTTAHVPAIGNAIARGQQSDPYWKPFFDGYQAVHAWLERVRPDTAIVVYNDHGLNFFLDRMPTFAVGAAAEYRYADEGWGLPNMFAPFPGDQALSWHVIESLVRDEFDVTTCQEMQVDHAFAIPMALLWPGLPAWPVKTIPIVVNTVQHPLPSAERCYKLGQAIGRAVNSYGQERRVVVIGTGGLSHQLDGTRAGFINKEFDQLCLEAMVDEPQRLTRYSNAELVKLAGSQGVELLNWLVARGALGDRVRQVHRHYHIPISNTAAGVLVLESAAPSVALRRAGAA